MLGLRRVLLGGSATGLGAGGWRVCVDAACCLQVWHRHFPDKRRYFTVSLVSGEHVRWMVCVHLTDYGNFRLGEPLLASRTGGVRRLGSECMVGGWM